MGNWIFEQADITGNGVLSLIELSRSVCAYKMWLGKRTRCPIAPDGMMIGIKDENMNSKAEVLNDKDWARYKESRARIIEVLKKYDCNGNSTFSLEDMQALLVQLGLGAADAAAFTKAMDYNGDARVTVDECLAWIFSGEAGSAKVRETMDPSASKTSAFCCIS